MLSILIPTYNYDTLPLVRVLHEQCISCNIEFEILVYDDGSNSEINKKNELINKIKNCFFKAFDENIGRTALRNSLANHAKYDNLLFIDSDTLPKRKDFVEIYLKNIKLGYESVFGGCAYQKETPTKDALLRWKYGKHCENINANLRNKKPYKLIISGNMLIKKDIFKSINKKMLYNMYGLDNYFGALLKKKNIKVFHINNEIIHLGIEKSEKFLAKKEESAVTLIKLYEENKLNDHKNDLLNLFVFIKKYKLNFLLSFSYLVLKNLLKKNLLGKTPSVKLLQFYRLSYMCYIDIKNKKC